MAWQTNSPDGAQSVKDNNTIIQANTTYTKTTMNVDHFWDDSGDTDGHHQFVQTVATNDADSSLETNPTLATGMDLVYYSRFKTASESTAQQDVQPYALNTGSVMQLLGIRGCVVFNVNPTTFAISIVYQHNITTVVRTGVGLYRIEYSSALPSNNYLAMGGGIYNSNSSSSTALFGIQSNTTASNVKSTGLLNFNYRLLTNTTVGGLIDPNQCWVVCFGG